jgi:hypothetical protein
MKLELKHLAGYLPYGLKCTDGELIGIRNHIGWMGEFKFEYGSKHIPVQSIKPILRPLSDLTKEIEVNGEKFVPVEKLGFPNTKKVEDSFLHVIGSLHVPYSEMQKLIEWHFDIHNLINNNLAIDINTLTK